MSDSYPAEVIAEIVEVLEWIEANPQGLWPNGNNMPQAAKQMPETVYAQYRRWKDIIKSEQLLDNLGSQFKVPGLSSFGRLWLRKYPAQQLQRAVPKGTGGRGRKPDTDPKEDKRIYDGWQNSRCRSFEEYSMVCHRAKSEIVKAVDRHRKRLQKGQEK
jgi:hypothetical protein